MATHFFFVVLLLAFMAHRLYRHGRNVIGTQPYSAKKMRYRLLVLIIMLALLLWDDWKFAHLTKLADASQVLATALLCMLLGIGGGALLGVRAARLAELSWDKGVLKLRGHAWFGPALLALYVLRLVYRLWLMWHLGFVNPDMYDSTQTMAFQLKLAEYLLNPFSSLLRGVVFAYYFTYYPLLMLRCEQMNKDSIRFNSVQSK